ncbi:MAG: hypothetical protein WCG26_00150 [Chloroflexales bacterium]
MPSALNTASILPGRQARWDDNGLVQEISEEYQVLRAFDGEQFDPNSITGMPRRGDAHPTLSALVVTSHEPREDATGVRWVITVKYSRVGLSLSGAMKRTKREWSTIEASRDLIADAGTGDPVLNAAGDPFERVPQVFQADKLLRVVRLENTPPATVLDKSGTINSTLTTGPGGIIIPENCGLLTISCRETDPTGAGSPTYLYEYTYDIHVRTNMVVLAGQAQATNIGWCEAFIESGYRYLKDGVLTRCVEEIDVGQPEGVIQRPSVDPVWLAANGTKLAAGADPIIKVVQSIPDSEWLSLRLSE